MDDPAAARDQPAVPLAMAAGAGFAVCMLVTLATGHKEAWDSSLYFVAGVPAMCVIAFVIALRYPAKPWRWAFAMAVGQSIALLAGGGSLALWPLTIVAMTILSISQWVAALVGSSTAQQRAGTH